MTRIAATGAGVRFMLDRQQRQMTPTLAHVRHRTQERWGVRGIDLAVRPGEGLALVGPNGAGKTTLLRLLAGVYKADEGTVAVRGRRGSLLAVGAGLTPQLTGRENAFLLAVLAGADRAEARAVRPRIEARCDVGAAFDIPVSAWSQGMRARLGFAVIEETRPDVLLLDEVHATLDAEFRERLLALVKESLDRGGAVVAASHDLGELGALCETAALLRDGRLVEVGPFADVTGRSPAASEPRP